MYAPTPSLWTTPHPVVAMHISISIALFPLSSLLRLLWERLPVIAVADATLVWLFGIWRSQVWLWVLIPMAFLVIAYFDTFLEYRDYSKNLRELQALGDRLDSRVSSDEEEPLSSNNLHGKLRMFPCILRHIRRRGFKDSFAHSYLYIGVPIGLSACYSPLISVDHPSWYAVMSIRAHDQLIRGGIHLSLKQKLLEFLAGLNEDPSQWESAYFVTSPCVLGMHNNPLAYIYLYDATKKLDAVILQLDTSYGERRLWIRRNEQEPDRQKGPFCFRAKYDKDLQVSPYMPFDGTSFVFDSNDPCASEDGSVHLVVTMSQGTTPFMVTSVTPNGKPLDVQRSSLWDRLRYLWHWAWLCTPTAVVWRILSMAASIFVYNRKSIVLNERPEPIKTATPKHARTIEKTLERYFVQILQAAVDNQTKIATVRYVTPGEHCPRTRTIRSKNYPNSLETAGLPEVTFTVTTPPFYSRFFHYSSPHSALVGELLNDERTRSSWCSHPKEFVALFDNFSSDMRPPTWRWRLITSLRCPPNPTTHPKDPPWESFEGLSASDCWVLRNCKLEDVEEYRRTVLRTYLSEKLGGVAIGPVVVYTEIFGLSRDGVLRIYEAWMKAFIVFVVAYTTRNSVFSRGETQLLAAIGINLWACFKAFL